MNLMNELSAVKKGIDYIDVHFQKIKQIRDKLTTAQSCLMMKIFFTFHLMVYH